MMQPTPIKEWNRHDVPAHRAQQPIAQARAAKRLQCVCGKVRRAIELECNAPIRYRQIYAEQPISRDVLELV